MASITQENNILKLSGDLLVDEITDVAMQAKTLEMQGDTQLDFSDVGEVDTSAISLVLELQRRAAKADAQILLSNPPKNLISLMALYGVEDFIASV